jgi:hypothetical protein
VSKQAHLLGDIDSDHERRFVRIWARTRTICSCHVCKDTRRQQARVRERESELPERHQRLTAGAEFMASLWFGVNGYDWDGADDDGADPIDCEMRSMLDEYERLQVDVGVGLELREVFSDAVVAARLGERARLESSMPAA